jgi:23S rRNA pseudouridine1911/1915/1917 synthase
MTRTLTVEQREAGQTILEWLRRKLSLSAEAVRQLLRARKVRVGGSPCSNPDWRLKAGQRVEVPQATKAEPPSQPQPVVRHLDAHIVVVEKPPGLTTMRHDEEAAEFGRGRRFLPQTLADLLPALIARREGGPPMPLLPVHRIDKETSGLVVFARNLAAEQHLEQQFRQHTIDRRYLALVRGQAVDAKIESWLVRDRGDGRRGPGPEGEGQRAVTQVSVVERLGDYCLVECRLETGRTHQVRIHLGEAGTPLCGERIYDRPLHGRPAPDGSNSPRVALHATLLGLEHPATGQRVQWSSRLPDDLAEVLRRLRSARSSTYGGG